MIGRVLGLEAAGWIPEVVRQLTAEGTLNDGFFEPSNGGIELVGADRTLPNKLVENF
jgi:hypothetical protein